MIDKLKRIKISRLSEKERESYMRDTYADKNIIILEFLKECKYGKRKDSITFLFVCLEGKWKSPRTDEINELLTNFKIGQNTVGHLINPYTLTFHCNWSWLMDVVIKIESLDLKNNFSNFKNINVIINGTQCSIEMKLGDTIILNPKSSQINYKNKIGSVYDSCYEFIEWYNLNVKKPQ